MSRLAGSVSYVSVSVLGGSRFLRWINEISDRKVDCLRVKGKEKFISCIWMSLQHFDFDYCGTFWNMHIVM